MYFSKSHHWHYPKWFMPKDCTAFLLVVLVQHECWLAPGSVCITEQMWALPSRLHIFMSQPGALCWAGCPLQAQWAGCSHCCQYGTHVLQITAGSDTEWWFISWITRLNGSYWNARWKTCSLDHAMTISIFIKNLNNINLQIKIWIVYF